MPITGQLERRLHGLDNRRGHPLGLAHRLGKFNGQVFQHHHKFIAARRATVSAGCARTA